jgi:YbbR domain-containing protein
MNDKKTSLPRLTGRHIFWMVFSVLCALLIWVYVTDTQGEDFTKNFPNVQVVFEGESTMREARELIITEADTNSVRVTLSGNRRTVSGLSDSDLTVVIDLSNITKTGTYSLAPRVVYPARTNQNAITQAVINPGSISFYVDKLSRKTVDVKGVFTGSTAAGFSASALEFEPSTVLIYGPENELARVNDAYLEVNRENVEKTVTFDSTFILRDADKAQIMTDDVTCDRETVSVTLPISAVKEVALKVDLVPGGGATEETVKYEIKPASIVLTGDSDTLAGVNTISIAKIDLATVDEALTETYKLVIPNNTEIMSGAQEATLTLEIVGLYKQTVSIPKDKITCINVGEGYTAQVMSDVISGVVLRGPERIVRGLSAVNIRAVADLSDFGTSVGIASVPVSIVIDGTTEVGAILTEPYKIYVNIEKTPETPEEMELTAESEDVG